MPREGLDACHGKERRRYRETVRRSKPCSPDELRTLFLFEKLTDDQSDWLCRRGRVEDFPAGPVYAEG